MNDQIESSNWDAVWVPGDWNPITYVCFLFEPKPGMPDWTKVYSPEWVDKLCRGIQRNTADPYTHFVCFTDKEYHFEEHIWQVRLEDPTAGFGCLAEAWRDDYTERRICVLGLDTIITGNIDEIVQTELPTGIGLLRDPFATHQVGNMVGLYDRAACDSLWRQWRSNPNRSETEQNFLRRYVGIDNSTLLNDKYPGQILSYKVDIRGGKWGGSEGDKEKLKILYFHGNPKPDTVVEKSPWFKENWI
jgi:hypothetical protein